jgi:hypothetical protein
LLLLLFVGGHLVVSLLLEPANETMSIPKEQVGSVIAVSFSLHSLFEDCPCFEICYVQVVRRVLQSGDRNVILPALVLSPWGIRACLWIGAICSEGWMNLQFLILFLLILTL